MRGFGAGHPGGSIGRRVRSRIGAGAGATCSARPVLDAAPAAANVCLKMEPIQWHSAACSMPGLTRGMLDAAGLTFNADLTTGGSQPPPLLPPLTDLPAGRGLDWSQAGYLGEGRCPRLCQLCWDRCLLHAPPVDLDPGCRRAGAAPVAAAGLRRARLWCSRRRRGKRHGGAAGAAGPHAGPVGPVPFAADPQRLQRLAQLMLLWRRPPWMPPTKAAMAAWSSSRPAPTSSPSPSPSPSQTLSSAVQG